MADIARPETANVQEIIAALREYGFTEQVIRETIIPYTVQEQKRLGSGRDWKVSDGGGFVTIRYFGLSRFSLEDHTGKPQKKGLAKGTAARYSSGRTSRRNERTGITMPPKRGRQAPEPEPQDGEVDYQLYLQKDISPTMTDYITWFEQNVARLEDVPIDKLLVLGSTLYPQFQKSDFNIAQRDARRAARAAASEPETPPARGRSTAKAGTAKGKAANGKAGTAPAGRRGGRSGRATAGAGAGGRPDPY